MESMRAIGDQMREAEAMGEEKPIDSLFKDFDERTADKANGNGPRRRQRQRPQERLQRP
jgi:hypothetical protein